MSAHDYKGGREFVALDLQMWLEPNTEPDGDGYLTLPLTQTGDHLITAMGTTQEAAEHRYFDTSYTYTFWIHVEP